MSGRSGAKKRPRLEQSRSGAKKRPRLKQSKSGTSKSATSGTSVGPAISSDALEDICPEGQKIGEMEQFKQQLQHQEHCGSKLGTCITDTSKSDYRTCTVEIFFYPHEIFISSLQS